MNRLPRRTSRIKPPLRGRLATVLSPEQKQQYSEPVVRKRPSKPKSFKNISFEKSDSQIPNGKLDELWNRLVALVILIILLVLIGTLF